METKRRQFGVTLTETLVVVAAVAALAVLGLPAIRAVFDSFESAGGTRAMISAALSSARAIAAKEQRYAGVRFQMDCREEASPLTANQYMIFIINEEPKKMNDLTDAFKTVEGIEPIKLPESVGIADLMLGVTNSTVSDLSDERQIRDTTTFSIVFSPAGKLVIHEVRTSNRDGYRDIPSNSNRNSDDDVFNKLAQVNNKVGMFYQDDYIGDNSMPNLGLGKEVSRNNFVIYDKNKFARLNATERYNYLQSLEKIYLNSYTGTIIGK